ncbi:MAG: pseudouridine-5'-phosphate glycosidase [Candidatus Cloacimonetes bacterium]|nr:pseudouridine-5'-phosphate glycosidase [Candidatus Cloacimonadota bacterium]
MNLFEINPIVAQAIKEKKPVIALESTIITHGLPYPQNLDIAVKLERITRKNSVIPATIGIIKGRAKIGLTLDEIEFLASSKSVQKVSIRNIAGCSALGLNGGTTVAATMFLAYKAGISVFATGGIGGVHRDADLSFDISADLLALSRYPVIVVSAGAKAILDLPKTIELLETLSVPVYGYQTDELPSFYSRKSGIRIESLKSPREIADIFKYSQDLNSGGMLIANPIPEIYEIPYHEISRTIEEALLSLKKSGIKGKEVTPFLLNELRILTQGNTVDANLKLIENNVRLACEIAKSL